MSRHSPAYWLSLALAIAAPAALTACSSANISYDYDAKTAVAIPDFPADKNDSWINGAPFSFAAAKGDVVLVEAWHRT